MYLAVIWTVVTLGIVVLGLSILVVVGRLVEDRHRDRRARRCAWMMGRLDAFLAGASDQATVLAELRADRAVALDALMQAASALSSGGRTRLAPLFRELGFVEQETAALRHRSWGRRLRAAGYLGVMGERDAAPALVHALGDEMLDVRLAAARSLAQLPAPEAIEPILRSLALPGELPLKLAADVLIEFGDTAILPLLAFLRQHNASTDGPAAAAAVTVLGMRRATAAVPTLIDMLSHPEPELRVNAARALGLIGGSQAVAALCERTVDPVWQVRSAAAQALGRLGDALAIPTLAGRLIDVAWWVRFNAAEALFRLGYPGRERLLDTLAIHQDRFARDISRQVLQQHVPAARPEVHAL